MLDDLAGRAHRHAGAAAAGVRDGGSHPCGGRRDPAL